jgi:hypothetical protein
MNEEYLEFVLRFGLEDSLFWFCHIEIPSNE